MTLSKNVALPLFAFLVVGSMAWNLHFQARDARAQPAAGRQKWTYATLYFEEPIGPDYGSHATWTTGKKISGAAWEKGKAHPFVQIYQQLGGKAQDASLGDLLDHIGHEGWELATHSRTATASHKTQTWTFKRPVE